jgi:hypothetical protein
MFVMCDRKQGLGKSKDSLIISIASFHLLIPSPVLRDTVEHQTRHHILPRGTFPRSGIRRAIFNHDPLDPGHRAPLHIFWKVERSLERTMGDERAHYLF